MYLGKNKEFALWTTQISNEWEIELQQCLEIQIQRPVKFLGEMRWAVEKRSPQRYLLFTDNLQFVWAVNRKTVAATNVSVSSKVLEKHGPVMYNFYKMNHLCNAALQDDYTTVEREDFFEMASRIFYRTNTESFIRESQIKIKDVIEREAKTLPEALNCGSRSRLDGISSKHSTVPTLIKEPHSKCGVRKQSETDETVDDIMLKPLARRPISNYGPLAIKEEDNIAQDSLETESNKTNDLDSLLNLSEEDLLSPNYFIFDMEVEDNPKPKLQFYSDAFEFNDCSMLDSVSQNMYDETTRDTSFELEDNVFEIDSEETRESAFQTDLDSPQPKIRKTDFDHTLYDTQCV
ncbi:hypothetical protein [Bufonid herpesvirus 1]|uniref:hypothetical protein n=1 Tax=Bufonid herpesvirus 1 TaxID=2282206 RepID=UPI000EB72005|nr:hypothetical protein [Bufonid herpesvirus 1]AXF48639.1 hypothetical protein [Bufonid herpesvirus 1]